MKVYIGGIGEESNWRKEFQLLNESNEIEFIEGDSEKKLESDFLLYVVTPKMKDVGAIINVVNDSNAQNVETLFCTIYEEDGEKFTDHQEKSLVATGKMVELNGGRWFTTLKAAINHIVGSIK